MKYKQYFSYSFLLNNNTQRLLVFQLYAHMCDETLVYSRSQKRLM